MDIEENLWEPALGIKGKIDVTARCSMKDSGRSLIIPIELKSGKGNSLIMQHRIQTQLYGMVQAVRSQEPFNQKTSIVCYIKTAKTFSIPIKQAEIDQILEKRNIIAGYFRRPLSKFDGVNEASLRKLPPLINNARECEFCYKRSICAFWAKQEGLVHEDKGVAQLFENDVKHLTDSIVAYVVKWTTLALLEQKSIARRHRGNEIWNSSSSTVSAKGLEPVGKASRRGTRWLVLCRLPVIISTITESECL